MIAALRWIRENIAVFGGDPKNVTVFGQSGCSMKISALMQMPAADGLIASILLTVNSKEILEKKLRKMEGSCDFKKI